MKYILVVDDDTAFLKHLAELISMLADQYQVFTATDGAKALAILSAHRIDLLVTDLRMPVMDGADLMRRALEVRPGLPVILMSACANAEEFGECGPVRKYYFDKPLNLTEFVGTVRELLV